MGRLKKLFASDRWANFVIGSALFGLGMAVFTLFFTFQDWREHDVARDLQSRGVATTARAPEVKKAPQCSKCTGVDEVRALIDYADGERVATLVAAFPDVESIEPVDEWVPSNEPPYRGTFEVVYDPQHARRVMASVDIGDVASEDWWSGGLVVAGACLAWSAAWSVVICRQGGFIGARRSPRTPGYRRRH
jgi:hypothetical protein